MKLGHDVNRSPPFRVFVKIEWSFTFETSIWLRDIDKDFTSLLSALCSGSGGSI